ncbi:MAG: heme-copper oxidase subunit III [Myxococcales bacterium]|nr:heme-copper oxidase subunit III [Myxococcales bacterium]
MTTLTAHLDRPSGVTPRRAGVAPNAVVGMLIFVVAEVMFFAALISAYMVSRVSATGPWPPIGQPRLPIEATAVNTGALLASGVAMFFASRQFRIEPLRAKTLLKTSALLGACFVCFQGYEWVQLIRQGLTLSSSTHGGFFYVIVGAHALHAIAGLIVLAIAYAKLARDELENDFLTATRIYWYLVVGLWPFLYWAIYL